jgi:[ribosomal protein S5]-alanine N-acetyltransferase
VELVVRPRRQRKVIAAAQRVFLRCFHVADLDAMTGVFGDPEVMRFGPGPQSRDWVQEWLRGCLEDYYQKWGFGLWAVVHKPDIRVIGFCGLTRFDDIDGRAEIEIGYRLARSFWGRGLATEAAAAVRDYAFGVLALPRLVSIIDPLNGPSIRVAEKIGLRYEKEVPFRANLRHLYVIHRAHLESPAAAPTTGS